MEISYTLLKTFMDCEYQYYLRYVKKVKLAEGSASAFGTAVHRTIKLAYDDELNKEQMMAIFKNEWMTTAYKKNIEFRDEKEYLQKLAHGQKMVADYYDKFMKGAAPPKTTELFFNRRTGITLGKHTLIGVFDQVDANDNIIDYKSGLKPTQVALDFDLQFTMYSYAFRQLYGKEENGLILRHLGTMKDLTTTRTETDFTTLLEEVDKIDERLKSEDKCFVRNLGRSCANCYFLEHCLGKSRPKKSW